MVKATWVKKYDSSSRIVWVTKEHPSVTIEAHDLEYQSRNEEDKGQWYVYGAVNGKGVPSSPEMVWGKAQAIREISKLKEAYKKDGLGGFK